MQRSKLNIVVRRPRRDILHELISQQDQASVVSELDFCVWLVGEQLCSLPRALADVLSRIFQLLAS